MIYKVSIFCIVAVLFVNAYSKPSVTDSLCHEGMLRIEQNDYDSAVYFFNRAHSLGMSLDSLYYFWAEVYLAKEVLDTALALNLATNTNDTEELHFQVLKQRYYIYSILGWVNEADLLADSLLLNQSTKRSYFIPSLRLRAGSRFNTNSTRSPPLIMYDDLTVDKDNESYMTPNIMADLNWNIPIGRKNRSIRAGILAMGELYRIPQSKSFSSLEDSLEYEAQYYIGGRNIFRNMSTRYSFTYRKNHPQIIMRSHAFELSMFTTKNKWIGFYKAEIDWDQGDSLYSSRINYSLSSYNSYDLHINVDLTFLTNFYYMHTDPHSFKYSKGNLFYYDGTNLYSDSTFSETIPFPSRRFGLMHSADKLLFGVTIPYSRSGFTLSAGGEFGLGERLRTTLYLRYGFDYYTRKHQWYNFGFSSAYLDTVSTSMPVINGHSASVARTEDGKYYLIKDYDEGFTVSDEELQIQFKRRRRIDNHLQASFSLNYSISALNSIVLSAFCRYRFTNLPESAPVEISTFSSGINLYWQWNISPDR
ncbi:hypothetical protein QA601_17980 [Chitinispirillales bacterium ANBcel5]|uniref:hypothetical protein n=1 Tax=Cellulosispirillum alkaliphilum TaxID=3039283 RepID=UPI002A4EBD72|nr:hypothetical protein [Chitinispirillales bacterium ANBcel5]